VLAPFKNLTGFENLLGFAALTGITIFAGGSRLSLVSKRSGLQVMATTSPKIYHPDETFKVTR